MKSRLALLFILLVSLPGATAATPQEEAENLFKRYIDAERTFDPAVADLYADDARIENKRVYPNGTTRATTMPVVIYRQLVRAAMPIAKARGDTNTYSDVKYTIEGERVRITAIRFSNLKNYASPISLLVGPTKDGPWRIYEELTESRP